MAERPSTSARRTSPAPAGEASLAEHDRLCRIIEDYEKEVAGLRGQQLQAIDGAKTLARDLLDFAEALRARVLDDDAPEAAIPPLAFYWQDQSETGPPPAADVPDRAR